MDSVAFSKLLLFPAGDRLDCGDLLETGCPSSDPGYYSACSSLSPASSIDSCCLSPPHLPWVAGKEKQGASPPGSTIQPAKRPRTEELPAQEKPRRSRSKFPGKKRESASEREKLRMRDLTKALHHLRTYLPPSVAPAGQTLTKIETLRLTMGYISHLSAQLGLGEEEPCLKREPEIAPRQDCRLIPQYEEELCLKSEPELAPRQDCQHIPLYSQGSSASRQWCQERLQGNIQSRDQFCTPVATCTKNMDPQMETDFLESAVPYSPMSFNQV
ncbi:hypothetical protein DPEC_G00216370 [Dallia pectoralis]|uniref:Uncharacterized protein n=1 Tax=Dallia pectoralis TaxID=75939 RepID=A0ACC2G2N2_DALPE|nr:hypothetical protein DPEC_G00216370 [Dallia pectoralis]